MRVGRSARPRPGEGEGSGKDEGSGSTHHAPLEFDRKAAELAALGFQRVETALEGRVESLGDGRHKVLSGEPSMGTLVTLTLLSDSVDRAREAMGLAFDEMQRVVDLLNRYDPKSALFVLNERGSLQGPPPELGVVVWGSLRMNQLSGGAFDPTVQPLVDLFRARSLRDSGLRAAADAEVSEARALVDARAVTQSRREISFGKKGMGMTLDGVAKGHVVDRMAEILLSRGIRDFLINAGGDIRAEGLREDGSPWRVGVQDPAKEGALPDIVAVTGGAVATSGSYEIYFDPDRIHHHIVSAASGASPQESQSVSVLAPTAMQADALATSVFVMEPRAGMAFIDSLPDCACLIVDGRGNRHASGRWRSAADSPNPKAGAQ